MVITSLETSLKTSGSDTMNKQMVFIQPVREVISSSNNDYDPNQLNTLLSTKNCPQCDLSYANLSGANLSTANLSAANLRGANLSRANLSYADLNTADLTWAFLMSAKLKSADLKKPAKSKDSGSKKSVFSGIFLNNSFILL